jgi:hypothetical protein
MYLRLRETGKCHGCQEKENSFDKGRGRKVHGLRIDSAEPNYKDLFSDSIQFVTLFAQQVTIPKFNNNKNKGNRRQRSGGLNIAVNVLYLK